MSQLEARSQGKDMSAWDLVTEDSICSCTWQMPLGCSAGNGYGRSSSAIGPLAGREKL